VTALFHREELARRMQRARELMDKANLNAILVTGDFSFGGNYYYLSGHLPRDFQLNFSRPHVMVLPQDRDPFLFVYDVNEQNTRDMSPVEDVQAYSPPFSGAQLARAIAERKLDSGRIGAEFGVDQRLCMPVLEWRAVESSLRQATFVDATDLLWRLRMTKSAAEIAYIKEAGRINGDGLRNAFARIKAGESEAGVARIVGEEIVDAGAYRPPYAQVIVMSQAKSRELGHRARMLGPSESHRLGRGDLLFVDSGAVVGGYWGEFNRMAVVGEPSARQRGHHDSIREIVARSIEDALKPGYTFESVIERMAGYYRDLAYGEDQFSNYMGPPFMHLCHGIGLASSEPPFVRFDSRQQLEPGMVLSCEAYLRDEEMTYGSEEDVVITDDGCEVLSDSDPGLFVLAE
jgi:Xaa-Pro aminopeptidase